MNDPKIGIKIKKSENWSNSFIFLVYWINSMSYHRNFRNINYQMAEYRTQMKIIGDILSTTRDDLQDEDGATVTYLIRKANISHSRISNLLKTLVSQGLLERIELQGSNKYKISQNGREFLQAYYSFTNFADNFGLSI